MFAGTMPAGLHGLVYGMRIYLVGGAVRDTLLGIAGVDRDFVVVGATPEAMLREGYRPVGKDFPVFLHPSTQEEYALARTERKTGPGYHGFAFQADASVTLEQDLERRDLTINAMAMDDGGAIVDHDRKCLREGGAGDLQQPRAGQNILIFLRPLRRIVSL